MTNQNTNLLNLSLLFADAERNFENADCSYLIQQLSETISQSECKNICSNILFEMNNLLRDLARAAIAIDDNETLDVFRVVVLDITNAISNLPDFLTHDAIFLCNDWLDRTMLHNTISNCLKSVYFVEEIPIFSKYASPVKENFFTLTKNLIEKEKTDCA